MADYRELLRKAIDALPDNTGANRRAVYEKARTALVGQLRAIEPPLPAREITTHRLALEDCIREVEHEATEKLLGRFRAPEPEPELPAEAAAEDWPDAEPESSASAEEDYPAAADPADDPEDLLVPEEEADETAPYEPESPADVVADAAADEQIEEMAYGDEPFEAEDDDRIASSDADWVVEAASQDWPEAVADDVLPEEAPAISGVDHEDEAAADAPADDAERLREDTAYAAGSIEDIIASAERAAVPVDEPIEEPEDHRVIPFVAPHREEGETAPASGPERHFLLNEADAHPTDVRPLVDLHGRPLSSAGAVSAPGAAMSSVREVELEPEIIGNPEISDAQVAIDRAIAALDREARGDNELETAEGASPEAEEAGPGDGGTELREESGSGGPGALTIFLIISVLLLGGGGAAGYWAWQQGYIDLNAVFAQGGDAAPTQVAEGDIDAVDEPAISEVEPAGDNAANTPPTPSAANTTTEVPAVNGGELNGSTLPSEEPAITETPSVAPATPEATFEDRLPAEADTPIEPSDAMTEEPAIAAAGEGLQSLLLEEQPSGATGAVPYSGSVEWSRGADELGNPTIVASATIPARNLDVQVLIRRNGDANLPASHLMEVNFDVAETFVGGSIANLPGVLLKDQELVQGQPLTGASARIVGNSFLFALSSASEIDVENNLELLTDRNWMDLAMVYGTGRRAIITLEKGEEGRAVFADVMAAWAELDAGAGNGGAADESEASAAAPEA